MAASDYAAWIVALTPSWLIAGLEPGFTAISDARAVLEALARRFTTMRGGLVGPDDSTEGNDGVDVRAWLNSAIVASDVTRLGLALSLEGTKDERVDTLRAGVTFADETLVINLSGVGAQGPFSFTLAIDQLTTSILNEAPLPQGVIAPKGTGYGTDVTTYPPGGPPPIPNDGILYGWGERFMRTVGTVADLLGEGARQAVKARFIQLAPPDALQYFGFDRNIERYPDETDVSYQARLANAFSIWGVAGTASAIQAAFLAYGLSAVEVYAYRIDTTPHTIYNWRPLGADLAANSQATNFSSFAVVVSQPMPWESWEFGDEIVFGDDLIFGTTMTVTELSTLGGIIEKWRPAHACPVELILNYDGVLDGPPFVDGHDFTGGEQAHLSLGLFFGYGPLVTFGDDVTFT